MPLAGRNIMALRPYAAVLIALYFVGCANQTAPQSFNQGFAYAQGLHTAVLDGATAALNSGTLGSSQAQRVLDAADAAETLLLSAQAANTAGNTNAGYLALQQATTALQALQTQLTAGR